MNIFVLCFSYVSTKLFGIDRTAGVLKWLGRVFAKRSTALSADTVAERAVRGMHLLPLQVECLDQAMATWFALNRHGYPAALKIGMRLSPLSGHAWVTCHQDTFVTTPGMEDFTEVASYAPWSDSV
jgi:hypothetical protein